MNVFDWKAGKSEDAMCLPSPQTTGSYDNKNVYLVRGKEPYCDRLCANCVFDTYGPDVLRQLDYVWKLKL